MPKGQGRAEVGLNYQPGKGSSVESQENFYVVVAIETAANGFVFENFAISLDDELPCYCPFELRSASGELDLHYSPIAILIELAKLRSVLGGERQCGLQSICALSDREAA